MSNNVPNRAYFETCFRHSEAIPVWPEEFVIISAYATTGATWTRAENEAADERLRNALSERKEWLRRIEGFSLQSGHAEPGWATVIPLSEACDIGLDFKQDAIFHILGDRLSVTFCDDRRKLILVGSFRDRLAK